MQWHWQIRRSNFNLKLKNLKTMRDKNFLVTVTVAFVCERTVFNLLLGRYNFERCSLQANLAFVCY